MGKFIETVAAMACLKSLLMIFNFVFWASGLALVCSGIWMHVEMHKYLEMNGEYSELAPYILVGTGSVILFVSTLACCCTIKKHPALLYAYGGFLGFILIVQLACATSMYAYRNRIANGFDEGLNNSMIKYGPEDVIRTIDFDIMQGRLKCCGNHGYKDWSNLARPIPVPKSCCKRFNCDAQDEAEIYREGCYDKVTDIVNENMSLIVKIAIIAAMFPIIGIVLTCCMAANLTKAKYEQMA